MIESLGKFTAGVDRSEFEPDATIASVIERGDNGTFVIRYAGQTESVLLNLVSENSELTAQLATRDRQLGEAVNYLRTIARGAIDKTHTLVVLNGVAAWIAREQLDRKDG